MKLTTLLLIVISVYACTSNRENQYQQPASRYYSNPYALPPQNQYPHYDYDNDRYYVPPIHYGLGRSDSNFPSPVDQKF